MVHSPVHFHDSLSYSQLDFLGNQKRLWTVPLVYNIFPTDGLREAAQLLLGVAAWSTLAAAVYAALGHLQVRRCALAAVLLVGLVPQVTGWDSALLSESIATSLLVLLVALVLRLARRPTPGLIAACIAVACLWEFTRQDNVLIALVFLPFVLIGVFRWLPRRTAWVTTGALCALLLWGCYDVLVATGDRPIERFNSLQILENRIAPDPAALDFFVARGLPESPEITIERGAFKAEILRCTTISV